MRIWSLANKDKRGFGFVFEESACTRCGPVVVFDNWSIVMMRKVLLSPVMNMISWVAKGASDALNGTEKEYADIGPDTYVPYTAVPARLSLIVDHLSNTA
jgi:hypothetical protein